MKRVRTIVLLIAVVLLLQAVPIQVHAHDSDIEQKIIDAFSLKNEAAGYHYSSLAEPGTVAGNDVSIESDFVTIDELETIFFSLRSDGRLPWYAAPICGYTTEEGSSMTIDFTPYFLDPEVYDRALYEQKVAEILAETIHEGMDQWQMALAVHDYLATHFEYDETETYHRGYDLLVRGTAVCEGYAEAYMDLMNRLGIQCRMVTSDAMEHGWNLINIYGNWYHVDVTWDDPVPDAEGYVSHSYFLVTDEELLSDTESPHYGWETDIACTDTAYTEAFWKNIAGAINYPSADTSYYHETDPDTRVTYIISREESSGEATILHTEEPMYVAFDDEYETSYTECGITLWNGRLYTCTMDSVYSMNPDGTDIRTDFTYDAAGNGKYIQGCFVDDGILFITLADPEGNQLDLDVPLDTALTGDIHTHSYIPTVVDATCTENGYTQYDCSCGISAQENFTLATGHTYGSSIVLKEATAKEPGLQEFSCIFCDDSYTEEISILEDSSEGIGMVIGVLYILAGPVIVILVIRAVIKKFKRKK